jgi:anaerobic selenocysteine-containing dehydrogenase
MAREGLKDGDHIWLYNSLDRIEVIAKSSEKTRSDVAELSPSMWRDDRGGINRLRPALLSDLGPTAAVNETKVKIKKM